MCKGYCQQAAGKSAVGQGYGLRDCRLLFCLPVSDLTLKVAVKQAAEWDEDEAQHEDEHRVQSDAR